MPPTKKVEYMCTYCGQKTIRSESIGRPQPGNCARRPRDASGKPGPHRWVKNRVIG